MVLTTSIVAAILAAPAVLADGDPASDVLLGENVFYPYGSPVSTGLQKTLNAETAAASRRRFPIKVALIAAPTDLGAIPNLFGKPQQYAAFLDQEISFQRHQPLLVVMASGYGVRGLTRPATAASASLAKPGGRQGNDLARAAILAVAKLAAAAGHPIKAVAVPPGAGAGNGPIPPAVAILALAAVATAAAIAVFRRRGVRAR